MTKTKHSLFMSAIALLLCCSMLIGTTFAWFTDSVTSSNNVIKSGTLEVTLEYSDVILADINDTRWQDASKGKIFNYDKWEPGYTAVKYVKIENEGSLDLKFILNIIPNKAADVINLADVIEVYMIDGAVAVNRDDLTTTSPVYVGTLTSLMNETDGAAHGVLYADNTKGNVYEIYTIALKMSESADNDYQGKSVGDGFSVQLLATQLTSEEDSFDDQYDYAAGTEFVGGKGTEEAPYLINEASQLMSISDYNEYTYFKIADGVETLDMTGVGKINLNGSFDGNGVIMNNLTTALFENVGKVGAEQDIKISNLTANVNTTDGRALVRNVINPGTTTFENVALHGYIEGQYNMGSFYNYGAANAGGSEGANYTVSFVNATSDVTLVCTSGNIIGGMLGHGFEGANYKLSINMDANSKYTGTMYTTNGGENCYQVMAMCSHATYLLNGVEISRYDNKYPSTKLDIVAPTEKTDGYYVDPVDGVDHYVVSLEAQLTAYDANNVKIPNLAGMTWSLGKKTISSDFENKVLDLVTSGEIVNDKNHEIGYELSGNALKVYSGRDINYKSGWITLNVTQYGADGKILATGNVRVYKFDEPNV